ncbi:MAG: PEP-CTERM sorting domain-containing protein [Sedimentisphaerales bacterium]
MKKCLFVLMVCLMATGAYASNSWATAVGDWSVATNWGGGHTPIDTDGEIKIIKIATTSCNLTSDAGSFTATKMTVSGNGALTLNILPGASMKSGSEFTVGCGTAGAGVPTGKVVQTGGTITLNDNAGTGIGKLELGYRSGSAGIGNGTYTISGGTINGSGGIYVGAMAGITYTATAGGPSGSVGRLVVQGNGGTISVGGPLFVGTGDATGTFTGTGTLEYQIVGGGVSAIQTNGGVYIDPTAEAAAVANLIVSITSGVPAAVILLVDNTGANAVTGVFDSVTLGAGLENYTLDYQYNNSNGSLTGGNDIALVPEPVTIALLGLGFLAIRRKK